VEAEAILGVLTLCEAGQVELMTSDTLVFEMERNPYPMRKTYAREVLAKAKGVISTDNKVETRARALQAEGIKPIDALHLASAVEAKADGANCRGDAMNSQAKPLNEITRHAIDLLSKEMGIVDTVRFLNQFTTGYGNYTEEREALFKDLTLDEILAAMKKTPSHQNG